MKKLMQLLAQAPKAEGGLKVEAAGSEATIYIYDPIGWPFVEARQVAQALAGITAETLNVRINSPGGDVFEARAIMTHLNAFAGKVVAHVDGVAASAASVIMLASDEVRMARGAFVMIHNPWGFAIGDAREMRKSAELLDKVTDELVKDYAAASDQDEKTIRDWMDAETWMTAEEAIANGFAHEIVEGRQAATAMHNLSAYARAPAALKAPAKAPAPSKADAALARDRERYERRLEMYERIPA